MAGPLSFEFRFARPSDQSARRREAGGAFRILVLADARGAAQRPGLAERPILPVDIDNFDAVLRRLSPKIAPHLDPTEAEGLEFAP